MKLVADIQLLPDAAQLVALKQTLKRCNEACNYASGVAFENKEFRQFSLQKIAYREMRDRYEIPAQMAILSVAKVTDAYKVGSKEIARKFRPTASHPFDARLVRICNDAELSIRLLDKRHTIKYVCGDHQRALLKSQKGEMDLMFVRGKWYLACTCDIAEAPQTEPTDFIGVDLGVVNIAYDSDGQHFTGDRVNANRRKHEHRRRNLQKKKTRSAKRKLKKISGRQARFQKDTNHVISKRIVEKAQRYGRGIALENLRGIRVRVKARRRQRSTLHGWGFSQLRGFIEYKARRHGVAVIQVDPRNTSRECSRCGHTEKSNRQTQEKFLCKSCGFVATADFNAALNIRARAVVNQPMVAAGL
jgi:IS605 OrfB family transposase